MIPAELRSLPQWIIWKAEYDPKHPEKPKKTPYQPLRPDTKAATTRRNEWATYEQAKRVAEREKCGIGFVFSKKDSYAGIDFDHCYDPATKTIDPWVLSKIQTLNSYAEISTSGDGVHVIVKGVPIDAGKKKGDIEMYSWGRYFVMTGNHLEDTPTEIMSREAEFLALRSEVFPPDGDSSGSEGEGGEEKEAEPVSATVFVYDEDLLPPYQEGFSGGRNRSCSADYTDEELVAKACQAKNGPKFEALWQGNWSSYYKSQSEADSALCFMLCYWTSQDLERVARLFRQSGLSDRDKWDSARGNETYGSQTIRKASAKVKDTYNSHLAAWREKMETEKTPERQEIDKYIQVLNKKHAVVMISGKCVVLNEIVNGNNVPDVTFSTMSDFSNYYANQLVPVGEGEQEKLVSIAKLWLASSKRRQFEGLVFAPAKQTPKLFNLWRGFVVKPVQGDWSLMRQHIQEIICSGNQECYDYLMAWLGRLVQDPGGERPGTSIVLRGVQGSGKGCFVSQFGRIFGGHFLHVTNGGQLVGRFNYHLAGTLLCFADEGVWAGDKHAEGVLKGMITEDQILCEPKGKDAFSIKNYIHLIIASNSEWVIPAGLEERRFLVLDVNPKRRQDYPYFQAIFKQMNEGGIEAMLYDLLRVPLDKINLRQVPRTSALLDQAIFSMSTAQKFWFERLRYPDEKGWLRDMETTAMYNEYLKFADNCGERSGRLIDKQFGKELRKLCPKLFRKRKRTGDTLNWIYEIPSLTACRKAFEGAVGRKIAWESDGDVIE